MRITDVALGEQYAVEASGRPVTAVRFVEVKKGEYTDAKVRAVEVRREDGELEVRRARELEPWADYAAALAQETAEWEADKHATQRLNGLLASAGIKTDFGWSIEGFYVHTNAEAIEQICDLLDKGMGA